MAHSITVDIDPSGIDVAKKMTATTSTSTIPEFHFQLDLATLVTFAVLTAYFLAKRPISGRVYSAKSGLSSDPNG